MRSRAPHRGATYRTIFALCYGLGLRGGEACALRVGDIDRGRELLVVKGGKFGKSRLVPHGPRIGELIDEQLERRTEDGRLDDQAPLFTFNGHASISRQAASGTFTQLARSLGLTAPCRSVRTAAAQPAPLVRGRMSAALVPPRA